MKKSLFWDDIIPSFNGVDKIKSESQKYAKTLLRTLYQYTEPVTEVMAIANTKGRTIELAKALRELLRIGRLQRSGLGKKGNPYKYKVID